MACCSSREKIRRRTSDPEDDTSSSGSSSNDSEASAEVGEQDPRARDAELAKLEKLGDEERARRLRESGWLLPPTGHWFRADDVTLLSGRPRCQVKAHVRHWLPPSDEAGSSSVKATLFFCHGLHAHVEEKLLDDFMRELSAKGFAGFALDLPGHGYSEGDSRCLVPGFQACFDVHEAFIRQVLGANSDDELDAALGVPEAVLRQVRQKPYFVMGESMGGMIAALMSKQISGGKSNNLAGGFKGAVLLCPALVVDLPPAFVRWLLQNTVVKQYPHRCMPDFLSSSAATKPYDIYKQPEHQEMIMLDSYHMPEYGWRGTAGGLSWRHGVRWATANAFLEVFKTLEDDMGKMTFPFVIIHDPKDKICFFEGSQNLMRLSPSHDKSLVEMKEGRHGLHGNKPEAEEVLAAMAAWMDARV